MSVIPKPRVGTGTSSPEERVAALQEWGDELINVLSGRFDLPDIHPDGRVLRGNVQGQLVETTFESDGAEVSVPHQLGFATTRWILVQPAEPAIIASGLVDPDGKQLYVRAFTYYDSIGAAVTTFPFKAYIFVYGRRPDVRVGRQAGD